MGPGYEWVEDFDKRQQLEIAFSRLYAAEFNHGTDGHNSKLIISKMAALLDQAEDRISGLIARLDQAEGQREQQ